MPRGRSHKSPIASPYQPGFLGVGRRMCPGAAPPFCVLSSRWLCSRVSRRMPTSTHAGSQVGWQCGHCVPGWLPVTLLPHRRVWGDSGSSGGCISRPPSYPYLTPQQPRFCFSLALHVKVHCLPSLPGREIGWSGGKSRPQVGQLGVWGTLLTQSVSRGATLPSNCKVLAARSLRPADLPGFSFPLSLRWTQHHRATSGAEMQPTVATAVS